MIKSEEEDGDGDGIYTRSANDDGPLPSAHSDSFSDQSKGEAQTGVKTVGVEGKDTSEARTISGLGEKERVRI